MCLECEGLGTVATVDTDLFLDKSKSLNEGAIRFPTLQKADGDGKDMFYPDFLIMIRSLVIIPKKNGNYFYMQMKRL